MQAKGTLFIGRQNPVADKDSAGNFRLELVLLDNQGRHPRTGKEIKEGYRVQWVGPEAQAFWNAHRPSLTPGAPLHVELERLRAHPGPQTFPPLPELRGHVVRMQLLPRRASAPTNTEAATA